MLKEFLLLNGCYSTEDNICSFGIVQRELFEGLATLLGIVGVSLSCFLFNCLKFECWLKSVFWKGELVEWRERWSHRMWSQRREAGIQKICHDRLFLFALCISVRVCAPSVRPSVWLSMIDRQLREKRALYYLGLCSHCSPLCHGSCLPWEGLEEKKNRISPRPNILLLFAHYPAFSIRRRQHRPRGKREIKSRWLPCEKWCRCIKTLDGWVYKEGGWSSLSRTENE